MKEIVRGVVNKCLVDPKLKELELRVGAYIRMSLNNCDLRRTSEKAEQLKFELQLDLLGKVLKRFTIYSGKTVMALIPFTLLEIYNVLDKNTAVIISNLAYWGSMGYFSLRGVPLLLKTFEQEERIKEQITMEQQKILKKYYGGRKL